MYHLIIKIQINSYMQEVNCTLNLKDNIKKWINDHQKHYQFNVLK